MAIVKHNEKITFIDDDGRTAVFHAGTASPFWWNDADGLDGLSANIYLVKGAGQDGETDVGANLAIRTITLEGQIRSQSQAYNRRVLLNAVRPAATGKLVYEFDGVTRYIRCRVKQAPEFSNTRVEKFQIVFSCANPFWRLGSGSKQVKDIALWIPVLSFPVSIPEEGMVLEYRSPSLIVNISNNGDVPVGMLVEFRATGSTSNPYLINVGTQEQLLVNRDMEPGDVIRVWTGYGEKRVELTRSGGVTNVFNDLDVDSVFLQLSVGDNLLRYGADVIDNLEATIYYDIAYVGV